MIKIGSFKGSFIKSSLSKSKLVTGFLHKYKSNPFMNLSFSNFAFCEQINKAPKDIVFKPLIAEEEKKLLLEGGEKSIATTWRKLIFGTSGVEKRISEVKEELFLKEFEEKLKPMIDPLSPNYLEELKKLSIQEQRIEFYKNLVTNYKRIEEEKGYQKRMIISILVLVIGLFALWIPFYRVICEHQGLSIKTTVATYKDSKKPVNNNLKFQVNFHHEVDEDLPWEFTAQQEKVQVNPGETCLVFYKARNKTDKPIVGLSVYDVQPQQCAYYFNKVQCFCFENQMLGPYEEVDLPVLFFLDPAIQEDKNFQTDIYLDLNLKYTFYMAKKQDLAAVMQKHLEQEKENERKLNEKKRELNLNYGFDKYEIKENENAAFAGLNPLLNEFRLSEGTKINKD